MVLASVPAAEVPGRKSLSDRVMALLERVDYRRADTQEDREAIFRLRYAAYRWEGAIPHSPSERFSDALDDTDNAWIFGLYVEGELASSIRLHVAHRKWNALPALDVFSDLLSPEIAAEHQAFYRRVFGHRLACEPRHYPLLSKPICLMALDYPLACERLLQRQPFFRSTVLERRTLFARAHAAVPRSAA